MVCVLSTSGYVAYCQDYEDVIIQSFAGLQDLDREGIAALVNRKLPPASSYSKAAEGGWADSKLKTLGKYLHFHRQSTARNEPTTPVALLDPILAQVAQDCEDAVPSKDDCNCTIRVASAMSANFSKETTRMSIFWQLLEAEYGVKFDRIKFGDAETDGSLMHFKGGLMVNIEVKNEVGAGSGAIHVQNAAYAAKYAGREGNIARQPSVCPTLLVELVGPNMSLSGAVFSDVLICDQLSPMVSLLWQPHNPLMLQAARCFMALRLALPRLAAYYDSVHLLATPRQLDFPYPTSFFTTQGVEETFQYTQRLSCLCFKAVMQPNDRPIFLKYCRSYSIAAHQAMALQIHAPALSGYTQLVQGW